MLTYAVASQEMERLLEAARQIYFRHGGDAMLPESQAELKARSETRQVMRMLTYAHVCSRMLTYAHVC
jgi:hypothetical protein